MLKRRTLTTALAAVISLSVFAAPVFANPGNGNGNGHGNSGNSGNNGNHGNNGNNGAHGNSGNYGNRNPGNTHTDRDQKSRKDYGRPDHVEADISFSQARSLAVNHRLTGYHALPPGIAKNLVRGKPLPPGIAKKTIPLSMRDRLPHYQGYEWRRVGDNLVLIALSTAVVTSIINGVFN